MLLWTLGCMYLFELMILAVWDIYPGVEFLFWFWETSILFSTVVAPVYITKISVWRFPFLYILASQHVLFLFFLVITILTGMSWNLYSFDLHVPDDAEHLFMYLLAICISSLKKYLFCFSVLNGGIFYWLMTERSENFWCQNKKHYQEFFKI